MVKRCSKCGTEKPLDQFNACARNSDGLQYQCRACVSEYNRLRWEQRGPELLEKRRVSLDRTGLRRSGKRWRDANREKLHAHRSVARALKSGRLVRPDACEVCGRVCTPEAHHDDYARRLDVRWLCRLCHVRHHHGASEAAA